jgi:hypothetical protein
MVMYFKANHKGLLCHSDATSLAEPLDMSISHLEGYSLKVVCTKAALYAPKRPCFCCKIGYKSSIGREEEGDSSLKAGRRLTTLFLIESFL